VRTYITIRVFSAPRHRDLRDHRLADRAGAHGRGPGLQLVQNGLNIVLSVLLVLGSAGGGGRGLGHFRRGMGGAGAGPVALPGGLRRARLARLGARLRRGEALADGGGERGYPDPLAPADGGFTSFLFFAADFGDVTLAANQVLIQFVYITAYAMDGFAFAAEALVGQAMGARARGALRRAAVLTSIWGVVVCVRRCRLFLFAGGVFIDLMTTAEDRAAEARVYLPWMIAGAAGGLRVMDVRRHLHRGDADARHAQHDGGEFRGLRLMVAAVGAGLGQPRALGGAAGVLCAQGADAWPALPGAGAAVG
jgi:MATE family multidrug resistance protein